VYDKSKLYLILRVLVTGSAGFIGFSLALKLLKKDIEVIGIDNHNDYYDTSLKDKRISILEKYNNYSHYKNNIADKEFLKNLFKGRKPNIVVNLAAQAGVRYSIKNPYAYIDSNIQGFVNILEECRHNNVSNLIYASSSSVYGSNTSMPFDIHQNVDHPLSLYAATKKSNELMAHTYSHLYNLPTTGLRFFTVYGPWGRPDMALFKFTKNILLGKKIEVFNFGKHKRDFTYIDDITEGLWRIINKPAEPNPNWDSNNPDPGSSNAPWRIYNIGNNKPIDLMDYINAIENSLNKKAKIEFLPLQPGDVEITYADVEDLIKDFDYKPKTDIKDGIDNFVFWYKDFYDNSN